MRPCLFLFFVANIFLFLFCLLKSFLREEIVRYNPSFFLCRAAHFEIFVSDCLSLSSSLSLIARIPCSKSALSLFHNRSRFCRSSSCSACCIPTVHVKHDRSRRFLSRSISHTAPADFIFIFSYFSLIFILIYSESVFSTGICSRHGCPRKEGQAILFWYGHIRNDRK